MGDGGCSSPRRYRSGTTVAESFRDSGHQLVMPRRTRYDLDVSAKELDSTRSGRHTDPAPASKRRAVSFPHHLDNRLTALSALDALRAHAPTRGRSRRGMAQHPWTRLGRVAVLTVQILAIPASAARSSPAPRASPLGQYRLISRRPLFRLDRRASHGTSHSGHQQPSRGGLRTQGRAGLRRPVPTHPPGRPAESPGGRCSSHHTCRAGTHRPDADSSKEHWAQLRAYIPSPFADS